MRDSPALALLIQESAVL